MVGTSEILNAYTYPTIRSSFVPPHDLPTCESRKKHREIDAIFDPLRAIPLEHLNSYHLYPLFV